MSNEYTGRSNEKITLAIRKEIETKQTKNYKYNRIPIM